MATLIFDIETVGEQWSDLDVPTQQTLSRWIERSTHTEIEKEALLKDLHEGLGFSPLTGSIVAIGLYDLERRQGAVYYTGEGDEKDEHDGEYVLKQRSEKEMLEDFWEGAKSYDTFVTFNGRAFDVPFILHRSVIHEVIPSRDLMRGRYLYQQTETRHIDLRDQLTFYGSMQRRPGLHLFCRAYGIDSPKTGGVIGDDVSELFHAKKFRDIARYNVRDVVATTEVYQKWFEYLAPDSFKYSSIE